MNSRKLKKLRRMGGRITTVDEFPRPKRIELSPDESGLDEQTRQRRQVLANMQKMTPQELFDLAVEAGIYDADGNIKDKYRQ